MFEFGLFSTHIPYIITVVAYLLSFGLYAFNKPNAEVAEQETAASISSSHEIRLENAANHQAYDATSHFQAHQVEQPEKVSKPLFVNAIHPEECCHPNTTLSTYYKVYALFSRPPTFC